MTNLAQQLAGVFEVTHIAALLHRSSLDARFGLRVFLESLERFDLALRAVPRIHRLLPLVFEAMQVHAPYVRGFVVKRAQREQAFRFEHDSSHLPRGQFFALGDIVEAAAFDGDLAKNLAVAIGRLVGEVAC